MSRRPVAVAMLACLVACSGPPAVHQRSVLRRGISGRRARGAPPQSGWPAIDTRIERRVRTDGLAGAVLVVRRGDVDVYRHAYGQYNLATQLPMASVSKWLTAALVMTLVDAGRLALDWPVARYVPSLRGPLVRVTMRELLSHTHGLGDAPPCVLSPLVPARQCDAQISSVPRVAPPGTRFRYGPTGPTLAGRIVELLTGQSFEDAFQARLARPLGLAHTSFLAEFQGERPTAPDPAAGVVSTAADYLRFEQMLASAGALGSTRVLSPASVDDLFITATGRAHFKSDAVAAELPSVGYALGAWVEVAGSDGRATLIDGSGGYGTYPWIDRRRGVYGILTVFDPADPGATGAVRASHDDVVAVEHTISP